MTTDSERVFCRGAARTVEPPPLCEERRPYAHLLLFAAACVALADVAFYGHPVGWTLGAYGLVSGWGIVRLGGACVRSRAAYALGFCFAVLCLRAVYEPEPRVVFLGWIAWAMFVLTLREGWTWRWTEWCFRGVQFGLGVMVSCALAAGFIIALPFLPLLVLFRAKRLRLWVIPCVLGVVFIGLFALANPVISLGLSEIASRLQRALDHLPSFASVGRFLFWSAVGGVLWASLRHKTRFVSMFPRNSMGLPAATWEYFLNAEGIRNALILFNGLFLFQTGLDLWYLWGGGALPHGLTYAEYAQRGAYPLILTVLLAAACVLTVYREGSLPPLGGTRALVYAWLAQNLFLVFAAGWRLALYVSAFSLTRWRLAAGVWMALIACGLVWIFVRIATGRSNAWLVRANAVTTLCFLMAYALWTPNRFIADFNVRHSREMGVPGAQSVDIGYLRRLGFDALPALLQLEDRVHGTPQAVPVHAAVESLEKRLSERLADWRGVTVRRVLLRKDLNSHVMTCE